MKQVLFLLLLATSCFGQSWSNVLSSSRAIDWTHAGLPATLPDGETTANPWTPPTGRTQSGSTITCANTSADATTINNALTAAAPGTYVLIGPGTCSITSNITMFGHDEVTLRGSGPMSTIFNLSGTNTEFQYGTCCSGLTAGNLSATSYAVGTTTVTITGVSSATDLVAGNYAWFQQCDTGWSGTPCTGTYSDPWPSGPTPLWVCGRDYPICTQDNNPNGTHNYQQQNVLLTNVVNNGGNSYTVTFTPGLYAPSWSSNNTAQLNWQHKSAISFGMGLENLTIHFTFNVNERIDFGNTYASWITGIRLIGYPTTSSFEDSNSARTLFANNYVFATNPDNLSSTISEPIVLANVSDTLLLNNIILNGLCNWGEGNRAGDVLAYQFCRDSQSPDYQIVYLDHGVADFFTLTEGNQFGKLQSDNTHGTHNLFTWFRNYLSGDDPPYNTLNPTAIEIQNFQRMGNVIGNAIGGAKSTTYQSANANSGQIYAIHIGDNLTVNSLMRWGNADIITGAARFCIDSTAPCTGSEVPTSLTGNASGFQNAVPANHNLPCSFFLAGYTSTTCTPHANGGTGLNFWKVCTVWTTFPTSCATSVTQPFPAVGPDVSGGLYVDGFAYDNAAAVAYKNLPIDTTYQSSFSITGSSWSGGTETLTVSLASIDNGSNEHIMGGFRLSGVNAACSPTSGVSFTGRSDGEILMTGSSTTTILYALAGNPGVACTGTLLFPDVRQFDARVFQNDPAGLVFSPVSISYNPQPVSTTSAGQAITITNNSSGTITLTSELLQTGTQFAISGNTCGASLAASANCTVTMTFTPTSAGTKNDNLVVTSSGVGSPQSVPMSGIGLATPVISPTTGTYSGSQTVSMTDATAGVTMYYTTNGSTPSSSSTLYSGSFLLSSTAIVKAIAYLSGVASGIDTEVITITGTNNNLTTTINHAVVSHATIN